MSDLIKQREALEYSKVLLRVLSSCVVALMKAVSEGKGSCWHDSAQQFFRWLTNRAVFLLSSSLLLPQNKLWLSSSHQRHEPKPTGSFWQEPADGQRTSSAKRWAWTPPQPHCSFKKLLLHGITMCLIQKCMGSNGSYNVSHRLKIFDLQLHLCI